MVIVATITATIKVLRAVEVTIETVAVVVVSAVIQHLLLASSSDRAAVEY